MYSYVSKLIDMPYNMCFYFQFIMPYDIPKKVNRTGHGIITGQCTLQVSRTNNKQHRTVTNAELEKAAGKGAGAGDGAVAVAGAAKGFRPLNSGRVF